MYYCKDFNGMNVLSLYEGELLGCVDKLYVDKKLKKLTEIELLGVDGAKLILPTKNIYRIGKNAITVKNNQSVSILTATKDCNIVPISSKAYLISGEFLGVIEEVVFNNKFFTEKILLDNDKILNVKNIVTIGKNIVVFRSENENVKIKSLKPITQPKEFKEEVVQQAKVLPIEDDKIEKHNVDKLAMQSSDFLLGRICTKDIFNFNNELLIKANALINKKNIKEIKKFGKLRELMIYSK